MPLAALTPVLNDLLNKDGGNSSGYPQSSSNSIESSNPSDYLRRPSMNPNQVLSVNDVSICC